MVKLLNAFKHRKPKEPYGAEQGSAKRQAVESGSSNVARRNTHKTAGVAERT